MTCHTCQQGIEVICDSLYGRRSFRCGCGVVSRREPPPPTVKARGNGFMQAGTFYGTCRNPACRQDFEAKWVRETCSRPECLTWVKVGRHEKPAKLPRLAPQPVTKVCRLCKDEFQTWKRTTCKKRECVNRLARERRKGATPTTITCEICAAQRTVVVRGRPPRTCAGACRVEFKRRYFATRYLNERKAS